VWHGVSAMEADASSQVRCDTRHQRLPNLGEGFLSSPHSSCSGRRPVREHQIIAPWGEDYPVWIIRDREWVQENERGRSARDVFGRPERLGEVR